MKKTAHLLPLSAFLSIVLFTQSASPTIAQSVITAIPPRLELKGDPGDTITAELRIRNDSEISQNFTVNVDDFIVVDNIGTPIPVATSVSQRWSLKNWITAPSFIPVDANGTQIVRLNIRIPLTALPGGHYAMVTYMPNADIKPGELKDTASLIGHRVGSLLYVTVSGPITENANVIKFAAPQFSEQGPVSFDGIIENLSDVHINPVGTITISNPLNNKVAEIPVEIGNIFPETTRNFISEWSSRWGWGRYKADLNLSYGTTGGLLTATIFFWLFPIRLVIYTLIIIIAALLVIIVLRRRNQKHQRELEQQVRELKRELEEVEHPKS